MISKITRGPFANRLSSSPNPPNQSTIITLAQKTLESGFNKIADYKLTSKNITQTALAIASIVSYVFHSTLAATIGPLGASLLPFSLMTAAGFIAFQSYATPAPDTSLKIPEQEESPLTQEQVTELYMNEAAKIETIPELIVYHQNCETFLRSTKSECTLPTLKETIEKKFKNLSSNEIQRFNSEKKSLGQSTFTQPKSIIHSFMLKTSLAQLKRDHKMAMAVIQKTKINALVQLDLFLKEAPSRS